MSRAFARFACGCNFALVIVTQNKRTQASHAAFANQVASNTSIYTFNLRRIESRPSAPPCRFSCLTVQKYGSGISSIFFCHFEKMHFFAKSL